ncbi:MAG: hypothetical protein ABFC96_06700 [Thermoguttaceae bacterium]
MTFMGDKDSHDSDGPRLRWPLCLSVALVISAMVLQTAFGQARTPAGGGGRAGAAGRGGAARPGGAAAGAGVMPGGMGPAMGPGMGPAMGPGMMPGGPLGGALAPDSKPEEADPDAVTPGPDPKFEPKSKLTSAEIRAFKKLEGKVKAAQRSGKFETPEDRAAFDKYYTDYYLVRWTWYDELVNLHKYRAELRGPFKMAKSGEVFDELNHIVLSFMEKLVQGEYYPATRVNAMLAIGELNSVEQAGVQPPVPLPDALKSLIGFVNNEKLPDPLRAAAMVGIMRHAALGVASPDDRTLVATAMLRIAAADVGTGKAAPGRQWILGQALRTLGLLKSSGEGNAVGKALFVVVPNAKLSLCTRSIAADAIGQLAFSDATGIDLAVTSAGLAQLASDACIEEIRLLKADSVEIQRGRIKQRLDAVLAALRKMIDLAKDQSQQGLIAELASNIKGVSDTLDDPRMRDKDKEVKAAVEELPKKIDALLKKPK